MRANKNNIGNALTTNDDLKSTNNFWGNDNKKNNGFDVNSDEGQFNNMEMDQDTLNMNNKPVVRNNFFYQGDVRQKKLTIEQKLKRKSLMIFASLLINFLF